MAPNGNTSYPPFLALPHMRYENAYTWLILMSALDIILTRLVLRVWEGDEVNPIAQAVIDRMEFVGAILFKFALVVFAIILCEVVGRLRERDGRRLSVILVVISAMPVAYTFVLLLTNEPPPPF